MTTTPTHDPPSPERRHETHGAHETRGATSSVHCARCGQTRPALRSNPFRAGAAMIALGQELCARICADCYRAWIERSVKVVNDAKLDLREARAQAVWVAQMRAFLNLGGSGDPWQRFVDRRVRVETTAKVIAIATLVRADDEKLWLADFEGGTIASGFAPTEQGAQGASGSASILRDCVLTIEEVAR